MIKGLLIKTLTLWMKLQTS